LTHHATETALDAYILRKPQPLRSASAIETDKIAATEIDLTPLGKAHVPQEQASLQQPLFHDCP
jgi:hypothetical protein